MIALLLMATFMATGPRFPQNSVSPVAATGARVYHIPYRLTDTRHILVRAKMNGKGPFNFILDTGAPEIYLSTESAAKLGWRAGSKVRHSASLEIEGGLQTASLPIRENDPAPLIGMNSTGLAGAKLDGIMGYTLLARYKIEIDFTKSYLVWTEQQEMPKAPASLKQTLNGRPSPSMKGVENLETIAKSAGSLLPKGSVHIPLKGNYGLLLIEKSGILEVSGTLGDSIAAKAGFATGDKLVSVTIGEREPRIVTTIKDLRAVMEYASIGQAAVVNLQRNGKPMNIQLKWTGRDF